MTGNKKIENMDFFHRIPPFFRMLVYYRILNIRIWCLTAFVEQKSVFILAKVSKQDVRGVNFYD